MSNRKIEEDGIIENHNLRAKFRVTFQNVLSRLRNEPKLVSKTFVFRGLPWNIGFEVKMPPGSGIPLNLFLNCLETKPGFSFKASCRIVVTRSSGSPLKSRKITTIFNNGLVRSDVIPILLTLRTLSNPAEGYIFDGALTLHVEMKTDFSPVPMQQGTKEESAQALQTSARKCVVKDLDALLDCGDGDVTFKLKDGEIITAHKRILSARNAVFAAMLSEDKKEAKMQMTQEVIIDDMGKGTLKILLFYIYTGQLSLPYGLDVESCKEVVNAADKYNLRELKEVAGMALTGLCNPGNALDLFSFCRDRKAKEATRVLANYVQDKVEDIFEKLGLNNIQ